MSFVLTVDWRFVAALGGAVCGIILCAKMDPDAAERVSVHAIDACAEFAAAE
ncbi:MAG: hypothetical protein J6M64_10545 [Oscillospiraceae bacterium]|nr:hypothetical protein [Oscillospiraceae bacterium]